MDEKRSQKCPGLLYRIVGRPRAASLAAAAGEATGRLAETGGYVCFAGGDPRVTRAGLLGPVVDGVRGFGDRGWFEAWRRVEV